MRHTCPNAGPASRRLQIKERRAGRHSDLLSLPPPLRRSFVVQSLPHLFLISLVVERQQPAKHLAPGFLADSEAQTLLRLVESVAKIEVGPVIGVCHNAIHLCVKVTQPRALIRSHFWVVETIVSLG